ncbi:hypothetical protein AAG570_003824 [Ranatra chinensis]|uniref:Uncharacterized protein n=1 Tax=Ranatra chinensis TaxID=642074 RepID=A0ABD0Y487_9HEMI
MASMRRNMFYKNKKQETTEIGTCNLPSFCDSAAWVGREVARWEKVAAQREDQEGGAMSSALGPCGDEGVELEMLGLRQNASNEDEEAGGAKKKRRKRSTTGCCREAVSGAGTTSAPTRSGLLDFWTKLWKRPSNRKYNRGAKGGLKCSKKCVHQHAKHAFETERHIKANDRQFNAQFNYAVKIIMDSLIGNMLRSFNDDADDIGSIVSLLSGPLQFEVIEHIYEGCMNTFKFIDADYPLFASKIEAICVIPNGLDMETVTWANVKMQISLDNAVVYASNRVSKTPETVSLAAGPTPEDSAPQQNKGAQLFVEIQEGIKRWRRASGVGYPGPSLPIDCVIISAQVTSPQAQGSALQCLIAGVCQSNARPLPSYVSFRGSSQFVRVFQPSPESHPIHHTRDTPSSSQTRHPIPDIPLQFHPSRDILCPPVDIRSYQNDSQT